MRRLPSESALLALLLVAAACDPAGDEAALPFGGAAAREAVVRSVFEEGWNRGDVESFRTTIADSVLFHYKAREPRWMSREELGETVLRWREAFPDLRVRLEELVVDGPLAAARMTLSGHHRGEWAGVDSTDRFVEVPLMMFFRLESGRIIELWEIDDELGFRHQLGILPDSGGG